MSVVVVASARSRRDLGGSICLSGPAWNTKIRKKRICHGGAERTANECAGCARQRIALRPTSGECFASSYLLSTEKTDSVPRSANNTIPRHGEEGIAGQKGSRSCAPPCHWPLFSVRPGAIKIKAFYPLASLRHTTKGARSFSLQSPISLGHVSSKNYNVQCAFFFFLYTINSLISILSDLQSLAFSKSERAIMKITRYNELVSRGFTPWRNEPP